MNIKNLLFVDDDEGVRRGFMLITKAYFHLDIDVAESYEDALEQIKKTNFDLIISDGLNRKCFDLYDSIKNISHGEFIIYSNNERITSEAKTRNIPSFTKMFDDEKLYSFIENYTRE